MLTTKGVGPDGRTWPSVNAAAEDLGCNRNVLRRYGVIDESGIMHLNKYPIPKPRRSTTKIAFGFGIPSTLKDRYDALNEDQRQTVRDEVLKTIEAEVTKQEANTDNAQE